MLTKIGLHKKNLKPAFTKINPLFMCLLHNGETDCCEGKHEDNDGISEIRYKSPLRNS